MKLANARKHRVAVYNLRKEEEDVDFIDFCPGIMLEHPKGVAPIAVSPNSVGVVKRKPLTAEAWGVILEVEKKQREGD